MNTDYYKVFLTVVETKNISKAADLLGYTQSGVSHIIGKMEKELQLTLLNRQRSGISVTEQAQSLLPLMEQVLSKENEIFQSAAKQRNARQSCIRVGTIHTIAISWLPEMLRDFLSSHDSIRFDIIEKSKYPELESAILQQDVDCAFGIQHENPKITFLPLFREDYYVVMPTCHPLAAFSSLSTDQLRGYPFILPEECGNHKELAVILQDLDVKQDVTLNTLDDFMTISLVGQGMGISIVPEPFLKSEEPGITSRKLTGDFHRQIGISFSSKSSPHSSLWRFIDYTQEWVRNMKK